MVRLLRKSSTTKGGSRFGDPVDLLTRGSGKRPTEGAAFVEPLLYTGSVSQDPAADGSFNFYAGRTREGDRRLLSTRRQGNVVPGYAPSRDRSVDSTDCNLKRHQAATPANKARTFPARLQLRIMNRAPTALTVPGKPGSRYRRPFCHIHHFFEWQRGNNVDPVSPISPKRTNSMADSFVTTSKDTSRTPGQEDHCPSNPECALAARVP
ncbi:hypothetical protein PpBr36_05349 [Pyricularia pennisetigena]|uniref:hypothetical protein n=1 Tax=Pyricularia pennisetigena TaxID=1578925 RepID=UPI00115228A2|nr:hypothetical protein PpBr36_05349 [Pyricularia pennisetigena]TLS26375.1 hypothetical protein PpBr36_05349 [Pyricularia pennisetigena]